MLTREPQNMQDYVLSGRPILHRANSNDGSSGLSENITITDDDVFLYNKDIGDVGISGHLDDVKQIINYHENYLVPKYKLKHDYYIGRHHKITNLPEKPLNKPDNRLTFNLPKKLVSTFNGYFSGEPVVIKHQSDNSQTDDDALNGKIQAWLNANDYGDVFSEWSKQADIYGRSYLYLYEVGIPSLESDEVQTQLKMAVCSPRDTIVVYDDSIERNPVFAIRYSTGAARQYGELITKDAVYQFDTMDSGDAQGSLIVTNADRNDPDRVVKSDMLNFPALPVIELAEDSDRAGLFDDSINIIDAIDNVMSSKGNDNDTFNESYLVITGDELDDKQIEMLQESHVINIYPKQKTAINTNDGKVTPSAAFLSPDPHDEAKENFLNRAIDMVYQTSQVVNLNDANFGMSAQSISGVALLQRYQPMQARARVKSHKMDKALRQMFAILFKQWSENANPNDLTFDHKQSIPHNMLEEAQTVKTLDGQVSDVTKLGYLSRIDDPAAEVERLKEENKEVIDEAKVNVDQYVTDQQKKAGVGDGGAHDSAGTTTDSTTNKSGQPDRPAK
ncbi:phage portal protein [Secundilactobacillus kimchicus]|uniref:phage portal protein n=1 Tax=Secundilactobacillus kimchicus TaxID=528209 RepID=UPI001C028CAE|nr:phage portal protein [Secundilactobacillus kimchicus]MBT9670864.1 phage portal protein [Secundilactobacillus kimchicus]